MRAPRLARITAAVLLAVPATALAGALEDGRAHLKERRWPQAVAAFREALRADPARREAVLGLAQAAVAGKVVDAYEPATGALSALLRERPADREARLAYGDLFLARAVVDSRYVADAQEQFQRLVAADPEDEDAVVGLVRYYRFGGDWKRADDALEAYLAKHPKAAKALFLRGTLAYERARDEVAATMTPAAEQGFRKAVAAFEASTAADPSRAEAWMHLAYASQYLSGVDAIYEAKAEAAYLKALDLDPADDAPMRGLSALYSRKADLWNALVARLAKERPRYPAVLFHWASALRAQGKVDEAVAALRDYVKTSRAPARGWYVIGTILVEPRAKDGPPRDAEGARKAFTETLRADPDFPNAEYCVQVLLEPIQQDSLDAATDLEKARAIQRRFEEVAALAPRSATVRNDLGFFLRQAYDGTGRKHRELLDASVAAYVAAADLLGEPMPGDERRPYRERHSIAQVVNDTGLMFFYYPPVRDLKKAERYYRIAMDWTQHGYWDAYGNMMKLLEGEKRLEDAYAFAEACAEGINNHDGTPNETFRRTAAADAERLKKALGR